MREPWKVRLKIWLCEVFGHRKVFSHHFGKDWYTCKRCKRMIGDDK